jgi:S-adenosylmethionine:tRNA ribosyltransferase-isomerase
MRMDDLDYLLPPAAIATRPAEPRDHSRLLVVHPDRVEHRHFYNLPDYLHRTDLLVTNETRVLPAKLLFHRKSGAAIPGLFISERAPGTWEVMLRTRGKVRQGEDLHAPPYAATLLERLGEGLWRIAIAPIAPAPQILSSIGAMPIPPYIEKERKVEHLSPELSQRDRDWYQTVFAKSEGHSVAAPTAGLHFTSALLAQIDALGVQHAPVELDVGLGTFLPVETDTLEAHPMHREHYRIPPATLQKLRTTRARNQRIIVCGTTAVRTLESESARILDPSISSTTELSGDTDLKISPGFQFRLTDALITNFHLPRSTLMALVAAYLAAPPYGLARLKDLYALAIREHYRFYSYGDAMLILPQPSHAS